MNNNNINKSAFGSHITDNPFSKSSHQTLFGPTGQSVNIGQNTRPSPFGAPYGSRIRQGTAKSGNVKHAYSILVVAATVAVLLPVAVAAITFILIPDDQSQSSGHYYRTHSTKTTNKDSNNYGDLVARIKSNYRAEKEKLRMSFESDSTRPSEVAKIADENINELSEVKSGSEIFAEVANIPEVASDAYVKENLDNYIAEYDEVINQARMHAGDYRKLATVNASINYYKNFAKNPDQDYADEMITALRAIVSESESIHLNQIGAQGYLFQLSTAASNIIADYELSGSGQLNLRLDDWDDFAKACIKLHNVYYDDAIYEYTDELDEIVDNIISLVQPPELIRQPVY